MNIISTAFGNQQKIPPKYTCVGENISPPLQFLDVPNAAKSLVVIVDDPDAPMGTWVHWVLYNLPADNIGVVENVPSTETLKAGAFQGKNDFGKIGYGGPCPPSGTHRYFFKVYALDLILDQPPGASKEQLEKAMKGHILARGELMGTYGR